MTRFARPYRSALALTAASFATATLFFATATDARAAAPVYVAQLAQPAPDDHVIVKGTVFYCDGATCAASRSIRRSRPYARGLPARSAL